MSELPNAIRRRLEVLTAVGLATVSTADTASTADENGFAPETGGDRRGR